MEGIKRGKNHKANKKAEKVADISLNFADDVHIFFLRNQISIIKLELADWRTHQ